MVKDALIIIRSVEERTLAYCQFLLEKQGYKDVVTIQESPFSLAVRKSYELGSQSGKKWTLCIDADVLVKKGAIQELIQYAESLEENVFEVQGTFIDKFLAIRRTGALHLYRSSLLPKALEVIPPEGSTLRPEGSTLKAMAALGYPFALTDILVGIHDFEQYYADIYRKCYTHAHKHSKFIADIESYWKAHQIDKDYEVALLGCRAGKVYEQTVYIDKRFLAEEAEEVLLLKKIKEKPPIDPATFDPDIVGKIVDSFSIDPGMQDSLFPKELWNKAPQPASKSPFLVRKLAGALWKTGLGIEKGGAAIKSWAEQIGS